MRKLKLILTAERWANALWRNTDPEQFLSNFQSGSSILFWSPSKQLTIPSRRSPFRRWPSGGRITSRIASRPSPRSLTSSRFPASMTGWTLITGWALALDQYQSFNSYIVSVCSCFSTHIIMKRLDSNPAVWWTYLSSFSILSEMCSSALDHDQSIYNLFKQWPYSTPL